MKEYKTLADWEKDMSIFRSNPNDMKFLDNIVEKVNDSSQEVRDKIQEVMYGYMMEKDPWRFFQIVMKEKSDKYVLLTKSDKDPWFHC